MPLRQARTRKTIIANLPCTLTWVFASGNAARRTCHFDAKYGNPNRYLRDFARIEAVLTKKYGQPERFIKRCAERHRDRLGVGLAMGCVSFLSIRRHAAGDIGHCICNEEFRGILHVVVCETNRDDLMPGQNEIREW